MGIYNLLSTTIAFFGDTFNVSLNWLGDLIRLLISGVGSVGLGIIVFSLILKLIVLPFDIYQRIGMRKQNQVMKENKEQMEKLQKQYANDKDTYNKKVMELQKKSGFSMCSSCLPMILSLVIFIVAINAFNAFSQYANVQNYNSMVKAYQGELNKYTATIEEGDLAWNEDNNGKFIVSDTDKEGIYIYFEGALTDEAKGYTDIEKQKEYIENMPTHEKTYYIAKEKLSAKQNEEITALVGEDGDFDNAVVRYFEEKAQTAVREAYNSDIKNDTKFLWIKNIWAVDATYKHPVLKFGDFKAEAKREQFKVDGKEVSYNKMLQHTEAYSEDAYNTITGKLDGAKKAPNGYFILIALSIGTILLQQLITMRSQKEQQKYSTVDGQGAGQQKMMLVMMTGMFAIFSFMYSSAFSIYMITSNIFSLLSTIVINKFVDKALDKKAAAAETVRLDNVHASRIEKAKEAGRKAAQEQKENKK